MENKKMRQRYFLGTDKYRDRLLNDKLKECYDSILKKVTQTTVTDKTFRAMLATKLTACYRFGLYKGKDTQNDR